MGPPNCGPAGRRNRANAQFQSHGKILQRNRATTLQRNRVSDWLRKRAMAPRRYQADGKADVCRWVWVEELLGCPFWLFWELIIVRMMGEEKRRQLCT